MPTTGKDYDFRAAVKLLPRLVEALGLDGPVKRLVIVAEANCVPVICVERYMDDAGAEKVEAVLRSLREEAGMPTVDWGRTA